MSTAGLPAKENRLQCGGLLCLLADLPQEQRCQRHCVVATYPVRENPADCPPCAKAQVLEQFADYASALIWAEVDIGRESLLVVDTAKQSQHRAVTALYQHYGIEVSGATWLLLQPLRSSCCGHQPARVTAVTGCMPTAAPDAASPSLLHIHMSGNPQAGGHRRPQAAESR